MTETLQNILVTAAAVAALAWLVIDRIRKRRRGAKCDQCALAGSLRNPAPAPPSRKVE